jgi:hypothetical protein
MRPNRRHPLKPLSGGVKTGFPPSLLSDGQSPFAENVEFANESVKTPRGSRKLNNQTLLRPALRCQPDAGYSPLYVEAGKSVPLRGYVYLPYSDVTDIGGDFSVTSSSFPSETFHNRRGRSFEIQISVRIPETFQMHERPARGEGAPTSGNATIEAGCGYDEGLDDCTVILQKGGDRTAPMSWALGITNVGNYNYTTGDATVKARKSNYFLTFMWLDAPEWGVGDPTRMRYDLGTYANNATGAYSTQALRAFILAGNSDASTSYALEPGRTYSISISVTRDSLTGGTTWAHDGRVDMRVKEENGSYWTGSFVDSGGGGTATNLMVWKGPSDSLRYLSKFGIRYSARDATYLGLGYRTAPWEAMGWIPYGHDSAAMEAKGFRMADMSLNSTSDLFGAGTYGLTCTHPAANAYLNVVRAMIDGTGSTWNKSVLGPRSANWAGFGANTGAGTSTAFNADALRGYRVVFPRSADGTMNALRGGRMTIQNYVEQASGDYRLFVQDGASLGVTWAGSQPFLIEAFRWNQQAIDVQDLRVWSSARDYSNERVKWSLGRSLELDDETEPELAKLQAYWPIADGGDRYVKEVVRGLHGFLAPFGLGLAPMGERGDDALFLSGEGDALVFDLSENPVFAREMKAMQRSNTRGFAVELTCIVPQAFYGISTNTPAGTRPGEYEAAYCPDLVTWAVKGADEARGSDQAMPLLVFGHHSWWLTATGTTPERRPQGFHLDYHAGYDSDQPVMTRGIIGFTRSAGGAGNWDDTAPWVGKRITIQVGVHPSPANRAGTVGKENEFRIYIAATPKGVLKYAAGENPQAEFAHYLEAAIQRKDLERLVVTIGGGWNPAQARGYTEYSCPLIVDEVRVYGATAPGELPSASGGVTTEKRGKILGLNSLPQRLLTREDILRPLGVGSLTAGFTEGSSTVSAPGGTSFFTQLPEATRDSLREKFLVPQSDRFKRADVDGLETEIQEFYWVSEVASNGLSATLATAYMGPESTRGSALCTNLVGYTSFGRAAEELIQSPLSIGSGQAYKPGTTDTKDIVLTDGLFENLTPIDGEWKIRVASPFTSGGLAEVLPRWVRGVVSPRRTPVTGITAIDDVPIATTHGAIYRIDDRWREDGPTDTLRKSVAILGRRVEDWSVPLAQDGIRFQDYSNAWPYWTTAIHEDFTWVYDFWVYLDEYADLQTMMWLGCEQSHLLLGPASTDAQRGIGMWFRLNGGRPELVRESAGNFSGGGTPPPDGRYTSTASDRVPLQAWTHVRCYIAHYRSGGTLCLKKPVWKINGRATSSTVNATETGLAGTDDWMLPQNGGGLIGSAGDTRNTLYLGIGRDAIRTLRKAQFAAADQLGGREFPGSRIVGRLHPLLGRMAGVAVWRAASANASVSGSPDFDPYTLDYTGLSVRFRADLQEGIGELVSDTGTESTGGVAQTVPGVILSHPALDLYNEFGRSEQAPSFAAAGQRIYAANGGRVAQVSEVGGSPAGVTSATTTPKFEVERKPLWKPNVYPTGSSSGENDPITQAVVGAGQQIYHYASYGNSFVRQKWHEELRWSKDDAAADDPFDIFGCKFYWKPHDVTGTIPLWSARLSKDSGSIYLESVDGKPRVGWWDVALKKQVYVELSGQVFRPGYWYYVYLRKAFPMQDAQEGNWLNSFWVNGKRRRAAWTSTGTWVVGDIIRNGAAAKRGLVTKVLTTHVEYVLFDVDTDFTAAEAVNNGSGATGTISVTPHTLTGDSLVIREFSKAAPSLTDIPLYAAQATDRSAISFTCSFPTSTNTTGVGQVTPKGALFSGAIGGVITSGTMLGRANAVRPFTNDMVGMYFQFAGSPAESVYKIALVTANNQITVVDAQGVTPNLASKTNVGGAVFAGHTLIKSPEFDQSNAPDQAAYDVEFMGTSLAEDPANGYAKHNGEFASFAWGVASSLVSNTAFYSGFNIFEGSSPTELAEMGTDTFGSTIYSTSSRPGELRVDSTRTFACVDTQTYVGTTATSTQPNAGLAIAMGTEASANAESCYWRHVREPEAAGGKRSVYVVFYDAEQNERSGPGPRLTISVPQEDQSNPSGLTRFLLTNLPVSHQRGQIQRWIYMTEADGEVAFRTAIVPDNVSSSVGVTLDRDSFDFTDELDLDVEAPPRCSVVGASQGAMFYGDIEFGGVRQRDLLFFSKPGRPVNVPVGNFLSLISGSNERITAMASLNGVLLVFKRDAMLEVVISGDLAVQNGKSQDYGCVGPQAVAVLDQQAYWMSHDRGMYVYGGAGGAMWLGSNVADIFEGDNEDSLVVDGRYLDRCVVGVNRRQNQVVALWKNSGEKERRRRLSIEYDSNLSGAGVPGDPMSGFRYALYSGPSLTAIGSVDSLVPGSQRFLGGTEDGFIVHLDRVGPEVDLHPSTLAQTVTLTAGSTTSKLVFAAPQTNLALLEGVRGVPVAWSGGRGTALFSDGSNLYLDRAAGAAPATGTVIVLGGRTVEWRSKWIDFETPEQRKRMEWLHIQTKAQASGTAYLEAWTVEIETGIPSGPRSLIVGGAAVTQVPLDLTKALHRIALGELKQAQLVQFRIKLVQPASDVRLEVTELTVVLQDTDIRP